MEQQQFVQLKNFVSIEADIPLEAAEVVCWAQVIYLAALTRMENEHGGYSVRQQQQALTRAHIGMLTALAASLKIDVRKMERADLISVEHVAKMNWRPPHA